jgi:hypothetical protein
MSYRTYTLKYKAEEKLSFVEEERTVRRIESELKLRKRTRVVKLFARLPLEDQEKLLKMMEKPGKLEVLK